MDTIAAWLHPPYTPFTAAVLATLVSGWLATTVDALPALALSRVTLGTSTVPIGVAAGLMLGAALFALLLPALEVAGHGATGAFAPAAAVTVALLVGPARSWSPSDCARAATAAGRRSASLRPRVSSSSAGTAWVALRSCCRRNCCRGRSRSPRARCST